MNELLQRLLQRLGLREELSVAKPLQVTTPYIDKPTKVNPAIYSETYRAPYAIRRPGVSPGMLDTLMLLAGKPAAVDTLPDQSKTIAGLESAGFFDSSSDRVFVLPRTDPTVLAHEFGHRYLFREGDNSQTGADIFRQEAMRAMGRHGAHTEIDPWLITVDRLLRPGGVPDTTALREQIRQHIASRLNLNATRPRP